jgi:hypothetical protein
MASITTQELVAIRNMMGAKSGAIDPYPIREMNQINSELASQLEQLAEIEQSALRSVQDAQEVEIPTELRRDNADED